MPVSQFEAEVSVQFHSTRHQGFSSTHYSRKYPNPAFKENHHPLPILSYILGQL